MDQIHNIDTSSSHTSSPSHSAALSTPTTTPIDDDTACDEGSFHLATKDIVAVPLTPLASLRDITPGMFYTVSRDLDAITDFTSELLKYGSFKEPVIEIDIDNVRWRKLLSVLGSSILLAARIYTTAFNYSHFRWPTDPFVKTLIDSLLVAQRLSTLLQDEAYRSILAPGARVCQYDTVLVETFLDRWDPNKVIDRNAWLACAQPVETSLACQGLPKFISELGQTYFAQKYNLDAILTYPSRFCSSRVRFAIHYLLLCLKSGTISDNAVYAERVWERHRVKAIRQVLLDFDRKFISGIDEGSETFIQLYEWIEVGKRCFWNNEIQDVEDDLNITDILQNAKPCAGSC